MEGYTNFPRENFDKHIETFYPLAVGLLDRDVGNEVRSALWALFRRVGEVRIGMAEVSTPVATPGATSSTATSPGMGKFEWGRKRSDSKAGR